MPARRPLTQPRSQPIYTAKQHFSIYDLDSSAAVEPRFQTPFVCRRSFAAGGCCCCRRTVYLELGLRKRVFYAGEPIEARLLVDNLGDARLAEKVSGP